jgi:hypothetical protein
MGIPWVVLQLPKMMGNRPKLKASGAVRQFGP